MKKLVVLVLLFGAHAAWAQDAVECDSYDHRNTWRISVTITDSIPAASFAGAIDTVVNTVDAAKSVSSGSPLLGGTAEREVVAEWTYFIGPAPRHPYLCTIAFKSYSLLELNGLPAGNRMTRYAITIDHLTANVTGKVQYETHDMTGAIVSVANGTFTGVPISGQLVNLSDDPYWFPYTGR